MNTVRSFLAAFGLSAVFVVVPSLSAGQVVLDRILTRINSQIVTQSDVDRARLLKLVDDPSSDDSTRRALENRLLIMSDMARLPPVAVPEQDLAARVTEWEASVGGHEAAARLLEQAAMSDGALRAWLRDDLRIRTHLGRQFGQMPDGDRTRAVADWVGRLRLRAGVK